MQAQALGASAQRGTAAPLGAVVHAIGRGAFAADALAALNQLLQVGSWSVYEVWNERPPVMHLSASHGVADTTGECFRVYRDAGLYRHDRSFDPVRQQRTGTPVVLRMHADEVQNPAHRNAIYLRHAMVERLSLAWTTGAQSLLAINLYHHAHQGCFGAGEVERFADAAPILRAAVQRHIEIAELATPADARARLSRRCPALTARELDVLERLLAGLTYDGIAADMGLSVGTIKTYRARAYERLGIHFKSQLFNCLQPPAAG